MLLTTDQSTASSPARALPTRPGAVAIVKADPTLTTAFLLESLSRPEDDPFSEERAARFLLWFILEGRHRYRQVHISPAYLDFLATPVPPYGSRLLAFVRTARADLRARFAADIDGLHAWYYGGGAADLGLGPFISARERLWSPDAARRPAADRWSLPGVNVIGFADAVMGIGEDARALTAALSHAGVPVCTVNLSLSGVVAPHGTGPHGDLIVARPLFGINIFALPPIETARIVAEQGRSLTEGRISIGSWPWELTTLPRPWRMVFDLVDEVWAPSRFLAEVYRGMTDKPVLTMPPYLNLPAPAAFDRARLGVAADSALFLTMLDFNSFTARKNPEGAIRAFRAAFPDEAGGERLVVKTLNASSHAEARHAVAEVAGPDPRILFVDEVYSRAEVAGLIAAADCLVSLHRAEGFGRVVAEAMALGTRVVATDWSGSRDFLDSSVGDPVGFALRDVRAGEYVLPAGSRWAEPDLEDAAGKLRAVRRSMGEDAALRQRARERVLGAYGLNAVASQLVDRLMELQQVAS